MTVCRNPRPNLSRRSLRRRAARTTFFLCLYAHVQLYVLTELARAVAFGL